MSFINLIQHQIFPTNTKKCTFVTFNGTFDLGNVATAVETFTIPRGFGRFVVTNVVYRTVDTPDDNSGVTASRALRMGISSATTRIHAELTWAGTAGTTLWKVPGSTWRPTLSANPYLSEGDIILSDDGAASYPTIWNVNITIKGFFLGSY